MSSNQAATNITRRAKNIPLRNWTRLNINSRKDIKLKIKSTLQLVTRQTNLSREAYICNSKSQFQFQNNKPIPGPEQEQQLWGCYETLVSKS
ncbi:hypothetical protein C5167_011737 [Papaver somniferum]|nr:hypothetical protein C5167_011737 [Papaver somniferum]